MSVDTEVKEALKAAKHGDKVLKTLEAILKYLDTIDLDQHEVALQLEKLMQDKITVLKAHDIKR